MGCFLSDRSSIVTELHSQFRNENELKTAFQLVVNSLLGENGFGAWGNGWWKKNGQVWSAKQQLTLDTSIELPFSISNDLVYFHDLTNTSNVLTTKVFLSGKNIYMPSLAGKNVIVEVINAKILRER